MKTIYLQNLLSVNGRNSLRSRKLFDKFGSLSSERILGHTILPNESYKQFKGSSIRGDLISEEIVREFHPDVIYIEGGFFSSKQTWKIPEKLAEEMLNRGTVIIIA